MANVWIPAIPSRYDPLSKRRIPTVDLSAAEQFGDLRTILPIEFDVDRNLAAAVGQVVESISNELAVDDYILAVGDLVCCAAAVAIVLADLGECKVLRWSKHTKQYSVVEVQL